MAAQIDYLNPGRYSSRTAAKSAVGRGNPEIKSAHSRASGFFVCVALLHQSMVGRAGQLSGWPGSDLTGISTPVRLTTHKRGNFGGELTKLKSEVATMATIPAIAQPVISIVDGKAVTTSIAIAEYFVKQHHHVVQKIESIECSGEFLTRNFSRVQFEHRGNTYNAYQITRDGFAFLAMGFTGKRAAQFKEAYITAFNQMEKALITHTIRTDLHIDDVIDNAQRVHDNLAIAMEVWVKLVIPQNPPILLSGTLLDSLHRTELVVEGLRTIQEGAYQ